MFFSSIKGALSGLRQLLAIESPLKMMTNAFYFTSKSLFVLKIFKLLSWFFGHVAKRLDWKNKVNFKFYGVIGWLTNILPNILKSKGNQTMTFGQLIEYNMRTIFLGKPSTKCDGEISPRPFSGNLKLGIYLDN